MATNLQAADIVLVRGTGWVDKLVRWFTRSQGEAPTVVNHVGVMVDSVNIVESAGTTIKHPFSEVDRGKVFVVRKKVLTQGQKDAISQKALSYVGRKYGYLKLVAHGIDHLLGDRYLFRRLCLMDDYPICSWVCAWAYAAAGLGFGVPPGEADPDSIWDYCMEKLTKENFELVYST